MTKKYPNRPSGPFQNFTRDLDFMGRGLWTDSAVRDWLFTGFPTGKFENIHYDRRANPYPSSIIVEHFQNSDPKSRDIFRRGVVTALNSWQFSDGLFLLNELTILVAHVRATEAMDILRQLWIELDQYQFDPEDIYSYRSNVLYYLRGLTRKNDNLTYQFFLNLYYNPATSYKFVGQIVLGLIKSRPMNIEPELQLYGTYITRFLDIAADYSTFYNETGILSFCKGIAATLDSLHQLFDILAVIPSDKQELLFDYWFAKADSEYEFIYDEDDRPAFVHRRRAAQDFPGVMVPVPGWVQNLDNNLNQKIQAVSAANESAQYESNAVESLRRELEMDFA